MTTKTDFQAIRELQQRFSPTVRGVLSQAEVQLITSILELADRTNIELQNIRDASVAYYGAAADAARDDASKAMELMDAMSGVCGVIDQEKFRRGMSI